MKNLLDLIALVVALVLVELFGYQQRRIGRREGIRSLSPGSCASIHRHRERATPRWIWCEDQRGHQGRHYAKIGRNEVVKWR